MEESISNIVEIYRTHKPMKFEDEITARYIEMLKNQHYEKVYQQEKFHLAHIEKYNTDDPWYCLSELLKKGGEYIITKDKQLVYINEKLIQGQKNTLTFVLKQMATNFFTGKSIMNVSLSVDIFEPRSVLERSAASYGCAPTYLKPVSTADPLTQIKNIFTFIASVPTLELVMQKPFNPILGETFQAYIQGVPIFYEQISHHPPISAYYMTCKEFTLFGNLVAFVSLGANKGVGGNSGVMNIVMENGSHFQCHFPPGQISGLIFGQRKYRAFGKGFIIEKKKKLFCQFSIEKDSKGIYDRYKNKMSPGDLLGGIFSVTDRFIQQISQLSSMSNFGGIKKRDIVEKICSISGVWFEDIYIDGEIANPNPKSFPLQYHEHCLPSDSNFRLDVMFHRMGNLRQSQQAKQTLEEKQRADRKLRQIYAKRKK